MFNPAQVQGLWICLTIAIAMMALCPLVCWVLPDRSKVA